MPFSSQDNTIPPSQNDGCHLLDQLDRVRESGLEFLQQIKLIRLKTKIASDCSRIVVPGKICKDVVNYI